MGNCLSSRPSISVRSNVGSRPPLIRARRWDASRPMTQDAIETRRREFWETAPSYDGANEAWSVIHSAVEHAQLGDDLMARSILSSAGLVVVNGWLFVFLFVLTCFYLQITYPRGFTIHMVYTIASPNIALLIPLI